MGQDGTYAVEGNSNPLHPVHRCWSNRLSGNNFAIVLVMSAVVAIVQRLMYFMGRY